MAIRYVSSVDGTAGGVAAVWWNGNQTTYNTITTGMANAADTDNIIYVDSAHNFSTAGAITMAVSASGRRAAVLSVNRATGAYLAGAQEVSTGNNFLVVGNQVGSYFYKGIKLEQNASSGTNKVIAIGNANAGHITMEDCVLSNLGTTVTVGIMLGTGTVTDRSVYKLTRCHFVLPSNASAIGVGMRYTDVEISGMTVAFGGANKPAVLFGVNSFGGPITSRTTIIDSDLSGFDAGSIVSVAVPTVVGGWEFRNCKFHATPAFVTGTWGSSITNITRINCDSGNTKTQFEFRDVRGTLTASPTIYADTGAEHDGGRVSWAVTTTADTQEFLPWRSPWIIQQNESSGALTVDISMVRDSAVNLTDRNVWLEVEHVSNASFPQGTLTSSRTTAPFVSGTDWAADSETWTGTGGFANENKQTLRAVINAGQSGLIRARVCCVVPSTTFYIDPHLRIS